MGLGLAGSVASSCGEEAKPSSPPSRAVRKSVERRPSSSKRSVADVPPTPTVESKLPAPPLPGYLLGDPPFVEGWDPEEKTCVSGNWCGPAALAAKVVRVGMEDDLDPNTGCVKRLMGKKVGGIDAANPLYQGLSPKWQMRGTLQTWRTQKARSQSKNQDICCYHWFDYCAGRPLDAGRRASEARFASTYHSITANNDNAEIARGYWLDGDDEYDSVAAFARCSLELFAVGAPPELIAASQRASLDELKHAELCRALSQHYFVHSWAKRRPVTIQPRPANLGQLLIDTLREGCVGESIAALRALRMHAQSKDVKVQAAMLEIAEDEGNHAALAWKILSWGLARANDSQKSRLLTEVSRLRVEIMGAPVRSSDRSPGGGRLSPRALQRCSQDAWQRVIVPLLAPVGLG